MVVDGDGFFGEQRVLDTCHLEAVLDIGFGLLG
jgi:hypothetical protein